MAEGLTFRVIRFYARTGSKPQSVSKEVLILVADRNSDQNRTFCLPAFTVIHDEFDL